MPPKQPKPSRFYSREFYFYYLVVGACFLHYLVQGVALSARYDASGSWQGELPGLQKGWLFGRSVDLSDIQWRSFREGLPQAAAALTAFALGSQLVQLYVPSWQLAYRCTFSVVFLGVLHQATLLFLLALLLANFGLAHALAGTRIGPLAVWAFGFGSLMAARAGDGFRFGAVSASLAALDGFRGMQRWHICYNLAVLRMISFGMDLHWARRQWAGKGYTPQDAPGKTADTLKVRAETPLPGTAYNLGAYLAYVLYPPLYIAGPTLTFNCYASQLQAARPISARQVLLYGGRLLASLLLLEAMTHTLYFNAIAKYGLWRAQSHLPQPRDGFGAVQVGMTGWWVLAFMWLKFSVIWRFFRLAALAAGVDAPENMRRCFANNYDIAGFWQNWHASFNLWLVRYLYIPLGGARTRVANVWVIFTFVALWHDVEWHLLGWAWLMSVCFAPELLLKWVAARPALGPLRQHWCYRHLCAAAAAVNITALMAANLIGFVLGLDGLAPFLREIVARPAFVAIMLLAFFSAAQVMFEIRRWEAAAGRRLCPTEVVSSTNNGVASRKGNSDGDD